MSPLLNVSTASRPVRRDMVRGRAPRCEALPSPGLTALASARGTGNATTLVRDQRQVPGAERRADRLEVGRAAPAAVARAARGHALGAVAGDEGAARIAGFGAHVGAGQAVDRALRVVDGLVQRLHGAAVPAGGRAGAADRSAGSGLVRVVDVAGAVVHVHDVVERLAAADLHPSAVGTGEDRAAEGARRGLAAGDAGADAAAVARGHEAGG